MKNWISAVIVSIILLGVGYGLRYCQESSNLPTEVPPDDTLYVYGDTVYIPQDTVWAIRWKKIPADTDTSISGVITKTAEADTILAMDKDTIKVEVTAEYNLSEDTFDLGIDVDFRGYDELRVDTLRITDYVAVEVPVDEPFYDEFVWGAGVMTVIFTALILFLGN